MNGSGLRSKRAPSHPPTLGTPGIGGHRRQAGIGSRWLSILRTISGKELGGGLRSWCFGNNFCTTHHHSVPSQNSKLIGLILTDEVIHGSSVMEQGCRCENSPK